MLSSNTRAEQHELAAYLAVVAEVREGAEPPPALGAQPDEWNRWRAQERRIADEVAKRVSAPVAASVHITSESDWGTAPARVYTPRGGIRGSQLVLHGGGFVAGSAAELVNDSLLSHRAERTGLRIISLEYSLAPQSPFPLARDEAIAAIAAIRACHPTDFLAVAGTSAGGAIIASAVYQLSRLDAAPVDHVLLEVPALSAEIDPHSAEAKEFAAVKAAYAPNQDAAAFVCDAPGPLRFPPTTILAAEHDVLRDAAARFAERLRGEGSEVQLTIVPGTTHGSPGATAVSAAARAWQDHAIHALITAEKKGHHVC